MWSSNVERSNIGSWLVPAAALLLFGAESLPGTPSSLRFWRTSGSVVWGIMSECFSALQPMWNILNSTRVCLVPITPLTGVLTFVTDPLLRGSVGHFHGKPPTATQSRSSSDAIITKVDLKFAGVKTHTDPANAERRRPNATYEIGHV